MKSRTKISGPSLKFIQRLKGHPERSKPRLLRLAKSKDLRLFFNELQTHHPGMRRIACLAHLIPESTFLGRTFLALTFPDLTFLDRTSKRRPTSIKRVGLAA